MSDPLPNGNLIHMAPPAPAGKLIKKGENLFAEGEASKSLFIVKKGTLSIRKRKGSAYVEVGKAGANEVLGELTFFDRMPRSASAVAMTDVEVHEIQFDALEKVWEEVPDYLKSIVAALADRLRKANETIRKLQETAVIKE